MAAVQSVPVIFVCRNNGYAISTPSTEQFNGDGIASRGVGYGIKTIRVDGNDILAVHAATVEAREYVIENNKPALIECMSYRLGAHSTSDDPSGYRSKDEENVWRDKDPIERMRNWLEHKQWLTREEDAALLEEYRAEVLAGLKRVEKFSPPPFESMITDVYEKPSLQLQEQFEELREHLRKYPEHYPKSAGSV